MAMSEIVRPLDLDNAGMPTFPFEHTLTRIRERQNPVVFYGRDGDIPGEPGWPDPDAWQINPFLDKLETPIDDRGLVRYDALIQDIKDTISPDYEWPDEVSLDHMYYEEEWYHSAWAPQCAIRFRELPVHKAIVPRVFENWKHLIVIPPAVPAEEVMQLRIESWDVATKLFLSICSTEVWKRRAEGRVRLLEQKPGILPPSRDGVDSVGKDIIREMLRKHFDGVERNLARLERLPPEFQMADPNKEPLQIANQLHPFVSANALYLVDQVAA
jgi:hypothetical protein